MNMAIPVLSSVPIPDIDNVSTSMLLMPLVTPLSTNCTYPPSSMIGSIADHDRPYAQYGHLSMRERVCVCFISSLFFMI